MGFSDRKDKEKALRFNETYLNYGNSYFPEHGYFKAPHKGVYLFVISVEFSSGPALGQLSFSSGYKRTLSSSQRKTPNGHTVTSFAMAEMEKGEKVCFELLQGTVVKRSPPGTTMGGFLLFKTWTVTLCFTDIFSIDAMDQFTIASSVMYSILPHVFKHSTTLGLSSCFFSGSVWLLNSC